MDETMNKRPSFQFYPADWLKDPDLQICSMSTIGIWINLLCRMWESKKEGVLIGTFSELALLAGSKPGDFKRFMNEAKEHNFCNLLHDVTKSDSNVTVICRRMNKQFKEREGAKSRMKKHRNADVTPDVTTPSSSSSSTSTSKKEKIIKKKYLDNVLLSDDEHSKLVERFGEKGTSVWIEKLDSYIGSKGRKYKSHYKTIISWSLKENAGTKDTKHQAQRTEHGRNFGNQESQYGETIPV